MLLLAEVGSRAEDADGDAEEAGGEEGVGVMLLGLPVRLARWLHREGRRRIKAVARIIIGGIRERRKWRGAGCLDRQVFETSGTEGEVACLVQGEVGETHENNVAKRGKMHNNTHDFST